MKKIVSFILTLIIAGAIAVSAFAAGPYTLKILADGQESATVPVGDKVKVTLQLSKSAAESIDLYSIQDYMCFDTNYLRLVKGSIQIYSPDGTPLKNTSASAVKFSSSPIDYENRVYFNRSSLESTTIPAEVILVTFQLEAQKEGTTKITHDAIEIFQNVGNLDSVSSSDATVIIGSGGTVVEKYAVNVPSNPAGGSVRANKTEAEQGDKITLTVTPNSDKRVNSVTVKDASGRSISVSQNSDGTYSFTMPASAVTVDVSFADKPAGGGGGGGGGGGSVKTYPVNAPSNTANGKITAPGEAAPSSTVTFTVTPNSGYSVDKVTVKDASGNAVTVKDNGNGTYTFAMPDSEVSISADFKASEVNPPAPPNPPAPVVDGQCPKDETCPIYPFPDADTHEWYHDGVHFALEKGYMVGFPEGTFQPNGNVTRAQLVSILFRMEGQPNAPKSPFTDVEVGGWYEAAVNWAAQEGVVAGTTETTFSPSDPITREQMAAILYRYANLKGYSTTETIDLSKYTDAWLISEYAIPSLQWANAKGLIVGMTDTTLEPQGNATRAQVASILYRFCKNVAKQAV